MTSKAWTCPPAVPPVLSYVLPIPEAADWNLPQGLSTASAAHSQPTQGCKACFFLPPLGLNLIGRSLDSLWWFTTLSTKPFPLILRPSLLHMKPTTEHQAKGVSCLSSTENKLHENRTCLHCCRIFIACNAAYYVIPPQLIPVKRMNLTISAYNIDSHKLLWSQLW